MIRPFAGIQAMGAAAQPVFGTGLTAAIVPSVDQHTGTNRPGTTPPPVTVPVTSTIGFNQGDSIQVGPTANFTTANRGNLDHGVITAIVDVTHMKVRGLLQTHAATGEWVVLDEVASYVQITPVATAADFYLGTDSTVAVGDPYVFDVIGAVATTVEPVYAHISPTTGRADSYQTSQYWINGAAAATFVARFQQN